MDIFSSQMGPLASRKHEKDQLEFENTKDGLEKIKLGRSLQNFTKRGLRDGKNVSNEVKLHRGYKKDIGNTSMTSKHIT